MNEIIISNNKNDFLQLEIILLSVVFFTPFLKKIPRLFKKNLNNNTLLLLEKKCYQFTNWNLILILINNFIVTKNCIFDDFITINSITICIIYHSFYLYDYNLLILFPKSVNMSFISFHTLSSIVHILPAIVYLNKSIELNCDKCDKCDKYDINLGLLTLLYSFLWCFNTIYDFNVSIFYFDIKNKNDVRKIWYFAIFINIFIGYLLKNFNK